MVDIIPANTSTFATIAVNGAVWDTIETAGDVDWFRLTLSTAGSYHINLGGDPMFGNALSDTILRVYDSAGVELRLDDDNGAGLSSYLDFIAASPGTYYVAAAGWMANTGDYYLSVVKDDIPTHSSLYDLIPGASATGRIDPGDVDTYPAYLLEGVTYTFTLESQAGGANVRSDPLAALVRKQMEVYDHFGNLVLFSTSQTSDTNVVITFQANQTGYYSVDVLGYDGAAQGYFSLSETANSSVVNHRPSGTDATFSIAEDSTYNFTAASFGFTDPDGQSFSKIIVASLPGTGSLTLFGAPVSVGQSILSSNFANLHWTPPANGNGNALASFTFEVVDLAPTSKFRAATDQTPNTITFNVTPVNDAPVITSGGGAAAIQLNINENTAAVTTIQASDPDSALVYAVAGADAASFDINASTGALSFRAAPDFETPHDSGLNNIYNVTVIATDGSLTDTQDLTVVVHNIAGNAIVGTKKDNTVDATHTIGGKGATSEEDTIDGRKGDDKLSGLVGNDTLIGGAGRDTLNGGAGFDRLDGGKDGDRFVFSTKLAAAGVDTIVKFVHGEDKLALDDKVFKAIGASLSADEFYAKAGATAAHKKAEHIVYNTTTGDLYYDKDGKGGAAAVLFATISNHPAAFDHSDVIIV